MSGPAGGQTVLIRGSYAAHTRLLRAGPILMSMSSADAVRIRQERRARRRQIRGRVVGYSVALFMVVWSVIAVVLITGHDPALSRKATTSAALASSANTAGTSSGSSTGSAVTTRVSGASSGAALSASNTAGSASSGSSSSTGSSAVTPVISGES